MLTTKLKHLIAIQLLKMLKTATETITLMAIFKDNLRIIIGQLKSQSY